MTRNEFVKSLITQLRKDPLYGEVMYYEDGFSSADPGEAEFVRNTNLKYHQTESDVLQGDFLRLKFMGDTPKRQYETRFEMNYLFDSYQKKGWDRIWEIIHNNLEQAKKLMENNVIALLNENDYETLKGHLFIRPLNYPRHRHELGDAIYRRIGDIALVLYILLSETDDGYRHDVNSAKIHRLTAEKWPLSNAEAFDAALINTYLCAPPRMYLNPFDTYNPPYQKGAFMALGSDMKSLSKTDVPTLTTTKKTNGAIAVFYSGVQEKIAEMYGGDYYVAFTGTSEARLHKSGSVPLESILGSLRHMNEAVNAPSEILSEQLYIYRCGSRKLEPVE